MESLFKFVLQRPAVRNDEYWIIDLSQNSNYQVALAGSIGKKNPREILKNVSNQFANGDTFLKSLSDLKAYDKIIALQKELESGYKPTLGVVFVPSGFDSSGITKVLNDRGNHRSSLSRNRIYSPVALAIPKFLAALGPLFS